MFPVEFRKNIIDICIHFFLAAVFSLLIYLVSANLRYSVIFFLGGILIDLDHFIDHFLFLENASV